MYGYRVNFGTVFPIQGVMQLPSSPEARPPKTRRVPADYAGLVARGFTIKTADVVPGVSKNTITFILRIYKKLVDSIRILTNADTLRLLVGWRFRELSRALPWPFLVAVGVGILIAVASLARLLESLLQSHPALLWSFFFGLVAASVFAVLKRVQRWSGPPVVSAVLGTVAAFFLVGLVPAQSPDANWFLFISGFIAICAMILPGISGSFILVLLGKYETVLSAVNNRDIGVLLVVAAGATVGILTFARLLSWLLHRFHDITVATLIGLMIGSLRKIWPWKETLRTIVDRHGKPIPVEQVNVLPAVWTSEVTAAVALAALGFAVVLLLEYVALRPRKARVASA